MSKTNNEYFETIRNASENNKLVVFVGSAVSYGSQLPSWEKLIAEMRMSLEIEETENYLKVAEHYYLQFGKSRYYEKIKEYFPDDSEPNYIHELLLELKPQHIVTTNWDDLIEKAVRNSGDLYYPVANDNQLAASPSAQLIVKMHGDFNNRNIVYKESDYFGYEDKFPLIQNFIKSIFSTHVVLFVGYSISDPNLNQVLSWVRKRTDEAPPSFTLLTRKVITISESNYLKEKGVYAILSEGEVEQNGRAESLKTKSRRIIHSLKNIVKPNMVDTSKTLETISEDVSKWNSVHPSIVVRLIRERLNLVDINEIYWESGKNIIHVQLNNEELKKTRSSYRKIRRSLSNILEKTPVFAIQLEKNEEKHLRLINRYHQDILDEFTTFDYKKIIERISEVDHKTFEDLDLHYKFAFENYFIRKLKVAYNSFANLTQEYYKKSDFSKSLISAYNKKYSVLGKLPYEEDDLYKDSIQETLAKNNAVSTMIERFPSSIVSRQLPLLQSIDANNTFLLQRFKKIVDLKGKIEDEIQVISNNGFVLNNYLMSIYNEAYCTALFIHKNQLTCIYTSEYLDILKQSFEAIIKRSSHSQEAYIDNFLAYCGIISFERQRLPNFLSSVLVEKKYLLFTSDAKDYLLNTLDNVLAAVNSNIRKSLYDSCIRLWENIFALLSFSKIERDMMSEIHKRVVASFEVSRWAELSESVNRFLVLQSNRYDNVMESNQLGELIGWQLKKINSADVILVHGKGDLLRNLSVLYANNNLSHELGLDDEFEIFVTKVKKMNFTQKVDVISKFGFSLINFTSGDIRKKFEDLLRCLLEEAKNKDFDERLVIYGLNLRIIKVINNDELRPILEELRTLVKYSLSSNISSDYMTIREQLKDLDEDIPDEFRDVVEDVNLLCEKMNRFLNYNNKA